MKYIFNYVRVDLMHTIVFICILTGVAVAVAYPQDTESIAVSPVTVILPSIAIPKTEIPSANIARIITSSIASTLFDRPSVSVPGVALPEGVPAKLAASAADMIVQRDFIRENHPKNFIGDKRTLQYMSNIEKSDASSANWKAWREIYTRDYPAMQYVRVPDVTQIRMIAEMRLAQNQPQKDNLFAELAYFKNLGYNTVLAVWEGESTSDLVEQIGSVRALGFKVFFTFGTRENLSAKIFLSPELYKSGLARFAASCPW